MIADGVLVVNKPRGPTSHDVVAEARRLLGTRAIGHAGTLDPMASGVLVLLVGEATKLAQYLTLDDKEYRATVRFGRSTDTLDAEGQTTEERELPPGFPDDAQLDAALEAERGRSEQVPPAFSAISVDGVRAHRRTRRGEIVTLATRPVSVRALTVLHQARGSLTVTLAVSKGYYVRAFARDLAARLGVPAHLSALERTRSGPYRIEEAVTWPPAAPPSLVSVADAATRAMPAVRLTADGVARAECGKVLAGEHFETPPGGVPVSAWFDPAGRLVALGRADGEDTHRVLRGFPRRIA